MQGQTLTITIVSGNNIGWLKTQVWVGPGIYQYDYCNPTFKLTENGPLGGMNEIPGTINQASSTLTTGSIDITIPTFQPPGPYNIEVKECFGDAGSIWYGVPFILPNSFYINLATSIQEHTTNKELLKVTDLLGRETKGTKNEVLFYVYDDGTVEKRIVIE